MGYLKIAMVITLRDTSVLEYLVVMSLPASTTEMFFRQWFRSDLFRGVWGMFFNMDKKCRYSLYTIHGINHSTRRHPAHIIAVSVPSFPPRTIEVFAVEFESRRAWYFECIYIFFFILRLNCWERIPWVHNLTRVDERKPGIIYTRYQVYFFLLNQSIPFQRVWSLSFHHVLHLR